jgi:hypothetical protein
LLSTAKNNFLMLQIALLKKLILSTALVNVATMLPTAAVVTIGMVVTGF